MKNQTKTAVKLLLIFTIVTGLLYPAAITLFSAVLFPQRATGSFIEKEGRAIGSQLIGQKFTSNKYFWPRPSVIDYQPMPSGASNLSQASSVLKNEYDKRKFTFLEKNLLDSTSVVPAEMLFASASGVDPHISPEAAFLQVNRIVKTRNFSTVQKEQLNALITGMTEKPQLGFLGKPVINVLLLNLELDNIK
jgi:potassium-transporting ATPase KdpC subunit